MTRNVLKTVMVSGGAAICMSFASSAHAQLSTLDPAIQAIQEQLNEMIEENKIEDMMMSRITAEIDGLRQEAEVMRENFETMQTLAREGRAKEALENAKERARMAAGDVVCNTAGATEELEQAACGGAAFREEARNFADELTRGNVMAIDEDQIGVSEPSGASSSTPDNRVEMDGGATASSQEQGDDGGGADDETTDAPPMRTEASFGRDMEVLATTSEAFPGFVPNTFVDGAPIPEGEDVDYVAESGYGHQDLPISPRNIIGTSSGSLDLWGERLEMAENYAYITAPPTREPQGDPMDMNDFEYVEQNRNMTFQNAAHDTFLRLVSERWADDAPASRATLINEIAITTFRDDGNPGPREPDAMSDEGRDVPLVMALSSGEHMTPYQVMREQAVIQAKDVFTDVQQYESNMQKEYVLAMKLARMIEEQDD